MGQGQTMGFLNPKAENLQIALGTNHQAALTFELPLMHHMFYFALDCHHLEPHKYYWMYALKFFMCTISPFGYGQEEIVMANKLWLSMTWVRQLNLVMVRPGLEIRIMIMDKQLVNELQVCDRTSNGAAARSSTIPTSTSCLSSLIHNSTTASVHLT